jgi:hypothetical protein
MVGEPPSTLGQLWLKSWKDTLSNNHQFIITCSSYTDDTKNAIISCIHPNSLCWQKDKVVMIWCIANVAHHAIHLPSLFLSDIQRINLLPTVCDHPVWTSPKQACCMLNRYQWICVQDIKYVPVKIGMNQNFLLFKIWIEYTIKTVKAPVHPTRIYVIWIAERISKKIMWSS